MGVVGGIESKKELVKMKYETKKFDGKTYYLVGRHTNKKDADEHAEKSRVFTFVRIVKSQKVKSHPYEIYARVKGA